MARVEVYRYEAVNGTLPRICLVCGAPAECWVVRKMFAYSECYTRRAILVTLLKEGMKLPIIEDEEHIQWCQFPLCTAHRTYWLKREVCGFGSWALLVVGGIIGLVWNNEARIVEQNKLAWLFIGLLAIWGLLTIMGKYAFLHVLGSSHTRLMILHASDEFAVAIAQRRAAAERDTPPPLPPDDNPFSGLGS
jgi:hypothetical protein